MFVVRRTDTGDFFCPARASYNYGSTSARWTNELKKARIYRMKNHATSSVNSYSSLINVPLELVRVNYSLGEAEKIVCTNLGYVNR